MIKTFSLRKSDSVWKTYLSSDKIVYIIYFFSMKGKSTDEYSNIVLGKMVAISDTIFFFHYAKHQSDQDWISVVASCNTKKMCM